MMAIEDISDEDILLLIQLIIIVGSIYISFCKTEEENTNTSCKNGDNSPTVQLHCQGNEGRFIVR